MADRRVSSAEVTRYVSEMEQEIESLQARLERLRQATGRGAARGRRGKGSNGAARRSKATAEQRASRQIQGRYLGLIRQIPANRRGPFQKVAREKGREAAIKELVAALGK